MVNRYVNEAENRRGRNSGFPAAMVMVGIGFGLICVLQSVLNISLRLHSGRAQPFPDQEGVLQENEEMKEKIKQLKIRNQELQDENANLTNEMEILRAQMDILNVTCGDSRAASPSCPKGWTMYRSSCYQTSKTTNSWDYANQDCERKGAHLLIFDDLDEEGVIAQFNGHVEAWIGLRAEEGCSSAPVWTWVDGSTPTHNEWNGDVSEPGKECVFLRRGPLQLQWLQDDCGSRRNWMCEREPWTL